MTEEEKQKMKLRVTEKERPRVEDYLELRERVGQEEKRGEKISEQALRNSLLVVSVYEGEKLVGLGRVVGDGGITYIVSDIMVDKEYQRKGIGRKILERIDKYLESKKEEGVYMCLIAKKPADELYRKYGFEEIDESRVGMLRKK